MKICPECKYERTIQDNLLFPDYECPSCGIIFEKDKAKQELAELEKQREKERKAKREKLKKEEERKRKEQEEKLRLEEEGKKKKAEAEQLKKLEEEKLHQAELERKRKEEEERFKKEEQERQEKEEAERLQKLAEEKLRKEREEQLLKAEEERLQKEAEEKLRLEEQERERQKEEAELILKEKEERIRQTLLENTDKIISPAETEKAYQLFDMCPFGIAQTGKGLSIAGFGETKHKPQHVRCMQKFCRLWTWKTTADDEVYAQGCSLQFIGLSKEEIERNFMIKNTQILEDSGTLNEKIADQEDHA